MIRWIASYPKSGNTWVRLFLVAYEKGAAFDPKRRPSHYKQDTDPETYKRISPIDISELTVIETRLLRGAVLVGLVRLAEQNARSPAYIKTHCANVVINGTAWIPPDLTECSLYIIRDPRDITVSFADHLGVSIDEIISLMVNDQYELNFVENIHQPLMSWSTHVNSWRRDLPFNTFALRYEDLLSDPDKWFKEILKFFGFIFNQERFDLAMKMTTFDSLRKVEELHGYGPKSDKQERFFREGKAGGWRNVLNAEQVSRIIKNHKDTMQKCGYDI